MNKLSVMKAIAAQIKTRMCCRNFDHKYAPKLSSVSSGASAMPTTRWVSSFSSRVNQCFRDDDKLCLNGNSKAPMSTAQISGRMNMPKAKHATIPTAINSTKAKL